MVVGAGAEPLAGRRGGEGGGGREERARQRRLERPACRQDLPPHGRHRDGGQWPALDGGKAAHDLGLPLRDIRRRILPSFEVSDLKGGLCALVEEVEDLVVDVVDPGAPIAQVHRDSYDPRMSTAHYRRTLHARASNPGWLASPGARWGERGGAQCGQLVGGEGAAGADR